MRQLFVLTCLFTGIIASITVYCAQLVWGDWKGFPDADTAFVHIAGKAGGAALFVVMNAALLVANAGSGMGAPLGAACLLCGMGRDNALPRSFFGAIDPRTNIPRNNVLLIGALVLAGGFALTYHLGAEMLNFGAFIAFMGVNLATFVHYCVRGDKTARKWSDLVLPILGFRVCLYIWWVRWQAKLFGGLWLGAGLLCWAIKTRGFRKSLVSFELPPE